MWVLALDSSLHLKNDCLNRHKNVYYTKRKINTVPND